MAESWKSRLRHFANSALHPLGLHLQRRDRAFEMDAILALAAKQGVAVRTWIDVGASNGCWSLQARQHFPTADFVLFEPLAERQADLQRLQERHGFRIVPAAAGASSGRLDFVVAADLDGSSVASDQAVGTRRSVPVETIDRVVSAKQLSGPYGLKLDTHGHEIAVLEGAAALLPQTALVIIEAYNFEIRPGSLRFHELCAWLEAAGFRCWNLADPLRRPGDGALWQMDLAFVPAASPLFASNRYA